MDILRPKYNKVTCRVAAGMCGSSTRQENLLKSSKRWKAKRSGGVSETRWSTCSLIEKGHSGPTRVYDFGNWTTFCPRSQGQVLGQNVSMIAEIELESLDHSQFQISQSIDTF